MTSPSKAPAPGAPFGVSHLAAGHPLARAGYKYAAHGEDGEPRAYTFTMKAAGILAAGWRQEAQAHGDQ